MFKGSAVAIVTPMTTQGELDETVFCDLVEWHIQEGSVAVIVAGSTGESATVTWPEQARMLRLACDVARKRIPVIAGTGTNATATAVEKTQAAEALGVDGCLVVTPYYNRPTQEGLLAHFSAIARAARTPILLYNVPSRTACDLLPETVARLSQMSSIVGIKEATGNLERLAQLQAQCRTDFLFYSGDDPTALAFIRQGGHGVISITANVAPRDMQHMCAYALQGIFDAAAAIDERWASLHRLMMVEPNPIPVKWILHQMGKIGPGIRLPLTPLSSSHHETLRAALAPMGILKK